MKKSINVIPVIYSILAYSLVFLIILDCHSVYSVSLERDFRIREMTVIVSGLMILFGSFNISRKVLTKYFLFLIFYYFVIGIYFIFGVNGDNKASFALGFFIQIPLFVYILMNDFINKRKNHIVGIFVKEITIISCISLFFWFFGSILKLFTPNMSLLAHWGEDFNYPGYYGLYYERQVKYIFDFINIANSSIFCESAMFSLVLVIALAIELFIIRSSRFYVTKISILAITIITSMSTTGIIMIPILFALRYIIFDVRGVEKKILKFIGLIIIAGLSVVLILFVFREKSDSFSWAVRSESIRAGLEAFKKSPIIGGGYGDSKLYYESGKVGMVSYSNSISILLAQGGIMLALPFFVPIFGCLYKPDSNSKYRICFVCILFIELVFTYFIYTRLAFMLIAYLYQDLFFRNEKEFFNEENWHSNISYGI